MYGFLWHRQTQRQRRDTIVGFTLTVVNEFRLFLSQFSNNFHEILHTLFSIHVVNTRKVSRIFDKYLRSYTIFHDNLLRIDREISEIQ